MKVTIYHTNDIHSHFDQMMGVAHFLKQHRQPQDLLFDCGDLCDLRSSMIQGTAGQGAIRLLQAMHYDALCIGNNEIDLEKTRLIDLAGLGLPLLSCNVRDEEQRPLDQVRSSLIIERAGMRFLMIGISPFYNDQMEANAYNTFFLMGHVLTVDPIACIRQELQRYQGQYDFCILLSHSGVPVEQRILAQIPEIDLCLGGHSHSLLQQPRYSQAARNASHIGVVELTIEDHQVTDIAKHVEVNQWAADPELTDLWQIEEKKADAQLNETLYTIPELKYDVIKESPLINFICDALYTEYPCDFTFMNAGIVSGGIGGAISKKKLIHLSPSKLNPTRFPVLGRNIRKAIKQSLDPDYVLQDGRGSGFRGTVLGTLGFSENVQIDPQTMLVLINGEPLDDERIYDCVANDYLQRGSGYPSLRVDAQQAVFYYGFIRDLLERHLPDQALRQKAEKQRIKHIEEA